MITIVGNHKGGAWHRRCGLNNIAVRLAPSLLWTSIMSNNYAEGSMAPSRFPAEACKLTPIVLWSPSWWHTSSRGG